MNGIHLFAAASFIAAGVSVNASASPLRVETGRGARLVSGQLDANAVSGAAIARGGDAVGVRLAPLLPEWGRQDRRMLERHLYRKGPYAPDGSYGRTEFIVPTDPKAIRDMLAWEAYSENATFVPDYPMGQAAKVSAEWVLDNGALHVRYSTDRDVDALLYVYGALGSLDATPAMRGAFANLDLRHTRGDVVRAVMEGVAFGLRRVLEELARLAPVAEPLTLVGGGANSPLWRQIYADVFGCPVARAAIGQQAAALGAALVAGVGAGVWRDFSILESIARSGAEATPDASASSDYSIRYARWLALSGKLGEWAK